MARDSCPELDGCIDKDILRSDIPASFSAEEEQSDAEADARDEQTDILASQVGIDVRQLISTFRAKVFRQTRHGLCHHSQTIGYAQAPPSSIFKMKLLRLLPMLRLGRQR